MLNSTWQLVLTYDVCVLRIYFDDLRTYAHVHLNVEHVLHACMQSHCMFMPLHMYVCTYDEWSFRRYIMYVRTCIVLALLLLMTEPVRTLYECTYMYTCGDNYR